MVRNSFHQHISLSVMLVSLSVPFKYRTLKYYYYLVDHGYKLQTKKHYLRVLIFKNITIKDATSPYTID